MPIHCNHYSTPKLSNRLKAKYYAAWAIANQKRQAAIAVGRDAGQGTQGRNTFTLVNLMILNERDSRQPFDRPPPKLSSPRRSTIRTTHCGPHNDT